MSDPEFSFASIGSLAALASNALPALTTACGVCSSSALAALTTAREVGVNVGGPGAAQDLTRTLT